MPSFADSAVIFVIALILFGPKKLPQLARQLGKLMGEFRRASNDFRMQMEDELRISEQEEHQKKIDALAPPVPVDYSADAPLEHPHLPSETPIAEAGGVKMMPPSTGLPEPSTNWNYTAPAVADGESATAAEATSNAGVIATEDHVYQEIESHELHIPVTERDHLG